MHVDKVWHRRTMAALARAARKLDSGKWWLLFSLEPKLHDPLLERLRRQFYADDPAGFERILLPGPTADAASVLIGLARKEQPLGRSALAKHVLQGSPDRLHIEEEMAAYPEEFSLLVLSSGLYSTGELYAVIDGNLRQARAWDRPRKRRKQD